MNFQQLSGADGSAPAASGMPGPSRAPAGRRSPGVSSLPAPRQNLHPGRAAGLSRGPAPRPVPLPREAPVTGLVAATGAAIISGPRTRLEYREFEPEPRAVPQARQHTRAALGGWGTGEVADDAELIVSELVTNAVAGVADLPFADRVGLLLAADDSSLAVLVWDASTQLPVLRPADAQASAGRGLQIIEALSTRWGCCADRTGKVVWALLSLDPGR
jgi:hypothetical protein